MTIYRQPKFSTGELSPSLWSRDDLGDVYKAGAKTIRNFFVNRQGEAMNRSGTRLVRKSGSVVQVPKLIPFWTSSTAAVILEIGVSTSASYIRIHANGATLKSDHTYSTNWQDGTPYEIPGGHPWAGFDFNEIRWAQSGDTMYLIHPQVQPWKIVRTDDLTWNASSLSFDIPNYAGPIPLAVQPISLGPAPDAVHPVKEWEWYASRLLRRKDGSTYETQTVPVILSWNITNEAGAAVTGRDPANGNFPLIGTNKVVLYGDYPWEFDFALTPGQSWPGDGTTTDECVATLLYRGRGQILGLVYTALGIPYALSDSGKRSSNSSGGSPGRGIDYGDTPDYTIPPPQGTNPFIVKNPSNGSILDTQFPQAITFHDLRLVFGGLFGSTTSRPSFITSSKVNSFLDFDPRYVPTSSGPFQLQLAALRKETIQSFVSKNGLLVFTDGGIWMVGTVDEPMDPTGLVQARLQSSVGASRLEPLLLANSILYEHVSQASGIRDIAYTHEGGGYQGGDLSWHAQHLFRSDGSYAPTLPGLHSWTFAESPFGVIWAVPTNPPVGTGYTLLSLSYDPFQGQKAWSGHDTVKGSFRDVATARENGEDAVYVVVQRTIGGGSSGFFIERMASRNISPTRVVTDACFVDCALTIHNGSPSASISNALTVYLAGEVVYGLADGYMVGPITVGPSGGITLPAAATDVTIGLQVTSDLQTLDLPGKPFLKVIPDIYVEVVETRGFSAGPDANNLKPWNQDQTRFALITPTNKLVGPLYSATAWDRTGVVFIRQTDPLPITIASIIRDTTQGSR